MNAYQIVDNYKNHILLRRKKRGDASELVGKVAMLLFFVNDDSARWTASAQKKFSNTHDAAMKDVVEAAKKYSVSVTIDTFVEEVTVPYICDVNSESSGSSKWIDSIMTKYSSKLFKGYRKHYKETLGYDQIAVAFVFNKNFRAYAQQEWCYLDTECSVLYASASKKTIIHELLHQFGAEDIYVLEYCMKTVQKLNYSSIMAAKGNAIDSLTAYTVGWCKEIDDNAVELLEASKHVKLKDYFAFQART